MRQRLLGRRSSIRCRGPRPRAIAAPPVRRIEHMDISLARQIVSFLGALLILVAYAGQQMNWMDARKPVYNILNAIGSAILAYIAFRPFQIGFVVLEVSWAVISVYALFRPRRQE